MLSLNKIYKISFQCSKYSSVRYFATSNVGKSKPNYYKILDITEKATPADIKAAFHKKAKEHHPDAQADRKSAVKDSEEKFKLAVEAYKILSDESKRKEYDESIKPKPSAPNAGATAWSQEDSSEGYSSARTRYHNEKFYGDYADYQQNEGPYQQYASPHPKQDPRQKKRVWASFDYENLLIGGLMLALALRWTMFIWDTKETRRTTFSEAEELDPNDAEEEGIYIEVPKDHTKPLSIRDCQGLRIEELEELDRRGYILPSSVKEEVMDYRETRKVYKKPNRANSWNYNQVFHEKTVEPQVRQVREVDPLQAEEEVQPTPPPKPVKKKPQKSLKEVADDVKKDIIQNTKEPSQQFKVENYVSEKKEEKATAPGEVRIPRMRANLYNMEKNS